MFTWLRARGLNLQELQNDKKNKSPNIPAVQELIRNYAKNELHFSYFILNFRLNNEEKDRLRYLLPLSTTFQYTTLLRLKIGLLFSGILKISNVTSTNPHGKLTFLDT